MGLNSTGAHETHKNGEQVLPYQLLGQAGIPHWAQAAWEAVVQHRCKFNSYIR